MGGGRSGDDRRRAGDGEQATGSSIDGQETAAARQGRTTDGGATGEGGKAAGGRGRWRGGGEEPATAGAETRSGGGGRGAAACGRGRGGGGGRRRSRRREDGDGDTRAAAHDEDWLRPEKGREKKESLIWL